MRIVEQTIQSGKSQVCLVIILALITLGPWLVNLYPVFCFYPDIEYVKAKVLRVELGELFADPITGYQNFHPPVFHMLLAPLHMAGIPLDYILWLMTIINIVILYVFVFKILRRLFSELTALLSIAMLPFISEFMGCGYILLPTAFYAGVSTYLIGLWLYTSPNRTGRQTVLYSLCWGITFLISPGFLFLIGLTLLYELVIHRNYRQFYIACGTMVICLIPFFYQAYIIFSQNLFGTSAFAFWRGIPDIEFFKTLVFYIVNPTTKAWTHPLIWAALPLTLLGVFAFIRRYRRGSMEIAFWFPIIATIAYLLTFYHFMPQYAIRIHFILSIFLVAYIVDLLHNVIKPKSITVALCLIFVIAGYIDHFMYYRFEYQKQNEFMPGFKQSQAGLTKVFPELVNPDEFILAHHLTYRHRIMPFFPAHALQAYRSGEYFQLTARISRELQADYDRILTCPDHACIDAICDKYGIKTAVAFESEFNQPLFLLIDRYWKRIYSDPYYRIYKRQ